MVIFHALQNVNDVLCRIKKSHSNDFGSVCILAVGDLFQLAPVAECGVYCQPQNPQKPDDLAPILWHNFKIHELTEVMWQKSKEFAAMLNAVCVKVPDDHSNEDLILLSHDLKIDCSHKDYPLHAMHVYPTNNSCFAWNTKMINTLAGDIYICKAIHKYKDHQTNLVDGCFPTDPHKTGNLLEVFPIKVGARLMLITNIDVGDGLTNGAMGTITHVIVPDATR